MIESDQDTVVTIGVKSADVWFKQLSGPYHHPVIKEAAIKAIENMVQVVQVQGF